jgi:hypothetical protein
MPLNLAEASQVLRELTSKRSYVKRVQNHLLAWFFELTENPNIFYQTVMRYDGRELTVTKVHKVRVDLPVMSDITKTWRQVPSLVAQFNLVRKALTA